MTRKYLRGVKCFMQLGVEEIHEWSLKGDKHGWALHTEKCGMKPYTITLD